METNFTAKEEVSTLLNNEILSAKQQFKKRVPEILLTATALVAGIVLFCFNLTSLMGLAIILFGALWNFFTESNRFFAVVMSFLMCVVYGFIAGSMKVYGHAFLHLMFYLPTQLIYYYENSKQDNSISHTKTLSQAGYIGTVVCGWLIAFGLGIILYKVGDPFYIIDAVSSTLLIVSVFLQNGKYKVFFVVRITACVCAIAMWLTIAIKTGFAVDTLIFVILFAMYTIMDIIKCIRWKKQEKLIEV